MGDLAFGCFALAKEWGKTPNEIASELESKVKSQKSKVILEVKAFGPYVNFFLNKDEVAKLVLEGIAADEAYGQLDIGIEKQILVEFACPNPMKAFHLGHLRNLVTGESVVRLFENAGYDVVRTNYQGDVGRHIAMSLWGIYEWMDEFEGMKEQPVKERVEFLGRAYAHGAAAFEASEEKKAAVLAFNKKVYEHDPEIEAVYTLARQWSLEYFDTIYASLDSRFDRFYFESETFERGREIALEALDKGIFKKSDGAVIYEAEKYGLHNRVFLNSQGFPTYEAKDLALAEMHFDEFPDASEVVHVVGKDQTEYFKVVFKAIDELGIADISKEFHLVGGYLQLKGDKKMSSRKGNIVTGDALIELVREQVSEAMKENQVDNAVDILQKVTTAALKYSLLKADITKDVAFDLEESISTSGNSGPYLLYIVARINSILKKVGDISTDIDWSELDVLAEEHALVMKLATYPEITREATEQRDTSIIAKYLFDLAQTFNSFYAVASVADSEGSIQAFRVQLIEQVRDIMTRGLWILGIETVEEM
jgi:arginyl-tRNA synthetase